VYAGVRTPLSQAAWDRNAAERKAGRVRVIPPSMRNVPPHATWESYRAQIEAAGAKEPGVNPAPELCRTLAGLAQ
jgi:hypothetical protein